MPDQIKNNKTITLTNIFDNISYAPDLKTEWGYACVIQTEKNTVLFDTGSNGKLLLQNMVKLNIDPQTINAVVISHTHWDHLGGLDDFLAINPHVEVYIPNSTSLEDEKKIAIRGVRAIRVQLSRRIAAGIFSIGELAGEMPEQSVVIQTAKGLIVLTGCAHPGIVNILTKAQSLFPQETICLAMGGFHLKSDDAEKVGQIIDLIQELGIQQLAPSHCTGEEAIVIFRQRYQQNFIQSGVGRKLVFEAKD
ncbi:MBL fold metallo-hydrolase [candidate division KSB1 bacterium]|nr:MBL fold metallo-hydrolase [candidate division KSB1 bacterium]